jgi:hypothetical protein
MDCKHLIFTGHAIRQMFERRIGQDEVRKVIDDGEVIFEYPEDKPFPSMLMLGLIGDRPLHIVVSYNAAEQTGYIITAYEPDKKIWSKDFKRRI